MRYLSLLCFPLCIAACAPGSAGPRNLSSLKAEVKQYAESGAYEKDVAASVSDAKTYLSSQARAGSRNPTAVFDIDETVLSNLSHMTSADWGYQSNQWDAWVSTSKAPAIAPVREIYDHARTLGFKVIFLTGRTEKVRAATARNLRLQGMGDYQRLILRPAGSTGKKESAVVFKSRVRENLTAEGFTIIASFGDQNSDLQGGHTGRTFKIPNPFYEIL